MKDVSSFAMWPYEKEEIEEKEEEDMIKMCLA